MRYVVNFYQDNIYEVWDTEKHESVFQGSLSDCEAWINLKEKGLV